jgi:SRSO17 transposase
MQHVSTEFDLYTDYLIINQGQHTTTQLSFLLDNRIKHDTFTRSLSNHAYSSIDLWKVVKPFVKAMQSPDGVLILDDTVEAKPYTDESDLICWHFDHVTGKSVKGINQLTALYYSQNVSLPVGYQLIYKDEFKTDKKTGKLKRVSSVTKHQYFQQLIKQSIDNGLIFKYVLSDKWFSSTANMNFIAGLNSHFIMPLKENRKIALSLQDQQQGKYQSIESLGLEENQTTCVYVKGMQFPLLITKQVFKNGDRIQGTLYLVTNDLTADASTIKDYYQRRWKVEEFYKSVKSNLGYAKSPAHTIRTQSNHLYLIMIAFIKLEAIKVNTKKNHFAIKTILVSNAMKLSMRKIQSLKETISLLSQCA